MWLSLEPSSAKKEKRWFTTPICHSLSINDTISFSVSPIPTMRCAPTFPSPKISSPASITSQYLFHLWGPATPFPLNLSKSSGVARSMATPILSAPFSFRASRSCRSRIVGLIRTDTGMVVSLLRRAVISKVCWLHLPLVIMEMQVRLT